MKRDLGRTGTRGRVSSKPCAQAGECTHLGVVLSTGEQGQLIGSGEVGPDLLHLTEPLPLAPFRSPVLKPHLGRGDSRAVSKGSLSVAGSPAALRSPPEDRASPGGWFCMARRWALLHTQALQGRDSPSLLLSRV